MSTTASPPTLQDLKPGDLVGRRIRVGFGGTRLKREVIERVTATQIVAEGVRYRRDNGRQVGGTPYVNGIFPWTSEHDAELIRAAAVDRFAAGVRDLLEWQRNAQVVNIKAATELAEAIERFLAAVK